MSPSWRSTKYLTFFTKLPVISPSVSVILDIGQSEVDECQRRQATDLSVLLLCTTATGALVSLRDSKVSLLQGRESFLPDLI